MSSSPSIDWVLDKVADLAGGSREDDAALKVLLTLVGSLDPPPKAVKLEPVASRIGKLRLAKVLDHPSDLRIGAVRLLTALDVPALATITASAVSSTAPAVETPVSSEPAPASAPTPDSAPEAIASGESVPEPAPETTASSEPAPETAESSEPESTPATASSEAGMAPPRQFRRAGGRVVLSFPHPGEEAEAGSGNGAS